MISDATEYIFLVKAHNMKFLCTFIGFYKFNKLSLKTRSYKKRIRNQSAGSNSTLDEEVGIGSGTLTPIHTSQHPSQFSIIMAGHFSVPLFIHFFDGTDGRYPCVYERRRTLILKYVDYVIPYYNQNMTNPEI